MAEVGLLPMARVALQVATQVLPPYRTRFSKHQFTQPQLLAVLCLMRFEDWTFREAETRLREHQELRSGTEITGRAGLHHAVSFSAATGRRHRGARTAAKRCVACVHAGVGPFLPPSMAPDCPTIPSAPSLSAASNNTPTSTGRPIAAG